MRRGRGTSLDDAVGMLTRAQVLSFHEKEFKVACAIGSSDWRIMVRHLLSNIIGPLIVAETLAIPNYISIETFLSFTGLGVNAPTPSWGIMIADGAGKTTTIRLLLGLLEPIDGHKVLGLDRRAW